MCRPRTIRIIFEQQEIIIDESVLTESDTDSEESLASIHASDDSSEEELEHSVSDSKNDNELQDEANRINRIVDFYEENQLLFDISDLLYLFD